MPRLRRLEPRLHVHDLRRAIAFYTGVLGFLIDTVVPDDAPEFAILTRDGVSLQLGGIGGRRAADQRSTCTLWLDVEDLVTMYREIAAHVAIEWGPEVYSYGRRELGFRDPDGNLIVLSESTSDPVTVRE